MELMGYGIVGTGQQRRLFDALQSYINGSEKLVRKPLKGASKNFSRQDATNLTR